MGKKLISEFIHLSLNQRLTILRERVYESLRKEDKFFERNALIDEIQSIKLDYSQVKELDDENILFYLNYNKNFAFNKFVTLKYEDRLMLLNRFLSLNMANKEIKSQYADFLMWSVNYLLRDKDMAKLVEYFCDNTNGKDSNLVYDVYSVFNRLYEESRCRKIMIKKYQSIQQNKENHLKSRIIL